MRIPPLNALRAFEAAARHGGYIGAAEELGVTRGAIARHIKVLEDRIGKPLFRRHARGVTLNPAGEALLPVLTDALRRIADGVERASTAGADLRIICPPSTSMRWLHPRLGEFRDRHPDISLQITTDFYAPGGFDHRRFNLGFSLEHWDRRGAELAVEPLFPLVITPACSPGLARRLRRPEDLGATTLLHERDSRTDWTAWLSKFPVAGVDPMSGNVFHNLDMAARAAAMGHGVVMADLVLCREDLEHGVLVRPFPDLACETDNGRFALIGTPAAWNDPPVAAFRAWVTEQAETEVRAIARLGWRPG